MANWLPFFFVNLLISLSNSYTNTYIGTEKTLQQNLADLLKGDLYFSDKDLPGYEGELNDITPRDNSEYDFIIVGAGSAGATIASRLSEVKSFTVLLIEAGSKEYPIMDIPGVAPALQLTDQINWDYLTESSDRYCIGMTDFRCAWPRGKVMGGSSILNYMAATRGNKYNYDEWAFLTGDETWSYKYMLEYFKKLEDFDVDDVKFDSKYRNRGGPLHITSPPESGPLVDAFLKAGQELGYPVLDFNGRTQIGFAHYQKTIFNGERWSTNRAYLYPAKGRPNLFLTRDSLATNILINKHSKSAYGVNFVKDGREFTVYAKKEIIVSAGSINSPQLLMLSGIGPKKHLRSLRIDVIKDLPVGKNLMDHAFYAGLDFETNIPLNPIASNVQDPRNPAIRDYITNRNGSLASSTGAFAFLNVDRPNSLDGNSNIEFLFDVGNGLKDPTFQKVARISQPYRNLLNSTKNTHVHHGIKPVLLQPKSRGKLLLNSINPNDKPKIYPNYFDHPDDVRVMIRGIRSAIWLSKTEAFQKYGTKLIPFPICNNYVYDSDAYWECAIRTFTTSIDHFSGTCKMGRVNDKTSVVNSRLQVIGLNRLRVADSSIFPNIISGHTNLPTIAIGEKLSDMVKEDWGYVRY